MAEERVQRRLSAIISADVVGYSRLMEQDEAGTLARLKSLRSEFLHPKIAEYHGRIVKTTGDGTLIEFGSAVDAMSYATDVQCGMAERNANLPENRQILLRLGVNLGDIIIDGDDIFGDGVNVASRLEALAEPGGICVSGTVFEHVRNKLDVEFEDLGEKQVKNIARAVRTYRVRLDAPASVPGTDELGGTERAARPGIAVLPFANMSGDPEQEYFADGMVEEIITGLARIRWLTVIARNSTFAYKGTAPDVRKVGRELDVRYVLEGSVRKAGDRVRITAQLIEAETGGHLWADRFDGTLADVFDLQDEITAGVVAAIEPSVRRAEIERAKRKRTNNLDAYDLYLRALDQAYTFSQAGRAAALAFLDAAVALDPGYAEAHGLAAWCFQQRYLWGARAPEDRDGALRHAEAVAAARTDDAAALAFAAFAIGAIDGRYDTARAMVDRSLAQNPSCVVAHNVSAVLDMARGNLEGCEYHADQSLRLSPFDPLRYIAEGASAAARLAAGDDEEALTHARRALEANPAFGPALVVLILSLVRLGRDDEARATMRELLKVAPETRAATLRERFLFADAIGYDRIVAELRTVGLPD